MGMNLFDLFAKISLDSSEYENGLKNAEDKGKKASSKIGNGLKTAAKIGGAALAAASTAAVGFGVSAVKAGMEFDVSMAQVAATMGKTVDEIQDLRDYAQEMGAKTAFSATQAADALNYMALAGYDSETSMKMLPNVLSLAAAGAMDLAQASDMITDTQSALGLSLDETSELVDKMAKASSKSNTSVSQLGEAMLTIGATAKTLSGGTTELSTALGILADNGQKGAEGGTRLRNIILSLSAPTDTAAAALDSLGVSAYDTTTGSLRPLQDILGDLNASMEDMTDQQKTDIINTVFNKTDLGAVNALLATSAERWDELGAAIEDSSGAAEKMANTQLDNLAGDVTLFKSALEGAQIAISDKLSPTLREFVQLGTSGLSAITDGFKENGLEGAFGALGTFLSDAIANITKLAPTIVKAAVKLISALIQGLRENAGLIIDAAFEIIDEIIDALTNPSGLIELVGIGLEIVQKLASGIIDNVSVLIPAVVSMIKELVIGLTDPKNLTAILNMGLELLNALADGIATALPVLASIIPQLIQNLVDFINQNLDLVIQSAIDIALALFNGLREAIPYVLDALPILMDAIVQNIIVLLPELLVAAVQIILALTEYLADPNVLMDLVEAAIGIVISLVKGIIEAIPRLIPVAMQLIGTFITTIMNMGKDILKAGLRVFNFFKDGLKEKWEEAKQWGKDLIQNFIGGITQKWEQLKGKITGIADFFKNIFGHSHPEFGPMADDYKWMPDMMNLFTEGIEKNTAKLQKAAAEAFDLSDAVTMPEMSYTSPVSAKASYTTQTAKTDSDTKFDEIMGILQQYLPQLANMKMVMDTGTLVGELTPGIDAELGARQGYAKRGAAVV